MIAAPDLPLLALIGCCRPDQPLPALTWKGPAGAGEGRQRLVVRLLAPAGLGGQCWPKKFAGYVLGHIGLRYHHGWIPLDLPIVSMGHSIGLLCDGTCLSTIIAVTEQMCLVRLEFPAFRSCKLLSRDLHKVHSQ